MMNRAPLFRVWALRLSKYAPRTSAVLTPFRNEILKYFLGDLAASFPLSHAVTSFDCIVRIYARVLSRYYFTLDNFSFALPTFRRRQRRQFMPPLTLPLSSPRSKPSFRLRESRKRLPTLVAEARSFLASFSLTYSILFILSFPPPCRRLRDTIRHLVPRSPYEYPCSPHLYSTGPDKLRKFPHGVKVPPFFPFPPFIQSSILHCRFSLLTRKLRVWPPVL